MLLHVQCDFFPGGASPVEGADRILAPVTALTSASWNLVVHVLDWHPGNHAQFPCNNPV